MKIKLQLRHRLQWLSAFLILTLLLPPGSIRAATNSIVRAQPLLLATAAKTPDETLNIIVQKQGDTNAPEELLTALGGKVTKDLSMINAFAAKVPASAIATLAKSAGVRWLSLDAPVVRTGEVLNSADESPKPYKALLPLLLSEGNPADSGQRQADPIPQAATSNSSTTFKHRLFLPLVAVVDDGTLPISSEAQATQQIVRISAATETVRDEFSVKSYSNNHGTQNWSGSWTEFGDDNSVDTGKVKINNYKRLVLAGKDRGVQRTASLANSTAATLSFDYRRRKLDNSNDYVTMEISSNGGTSWTELARFAGPAHDGGFLPVSYDISAYASANTVVRWLSSPSLGNYDKLLIDNVQISYQIDDGSGQSGGSSGSGGSGASYSVRDDFSAVAFSGNDGMDVWVSDWVEDDPGSTDQNPADGYIRISNGELRLSNQNTGNTEPSAARAVNLARVTNAILRFDFRTSSGVDRADAIAVEVSPDGGANYVVLDTIGDITGSSSGARSYDITRFASIDTVVRLRIGYFYGSSNEYFYVDNLEVAYTYDGEIPMYVNVQSVADDVNAYPYVFANDSGTRNWSTAWQEIGESDGPSAGNVYRTSYEGGGRLVLRTVADPDWEAVVGLQRSADLTGAAWAELSFRYSRMTMEAADYVAAEVSTDSGITWTEVGRIQGDGALATTGSDPGWRLAAYDMSSFISNNTTIRIISNFDHEDYFDYIFLDDIQIAFDSPTGVLPPNYYLDTLNVQPVWDMGVTGAGVTVAVVDSGVALDHDFGSETGQPDASRVLLQRGFNQTSDIVYDAYGHGTHVAGIVGSNGTGSSGVYMGIAPKANLIGLKVSDDYGMAYESDTVAALQWIFDNKDIHNIRVVNLSINSTVEQSYHQSPLNAAVEILWLNGVVVVASAGNSDATGTFNIANAAPANDPLIITVGASDEQGTADRTDDVVPAFSAYGTTTDGVVKPDIIAPGKDIISVLAASSWWRNDHPARFVEGGYFRISGTSMAAPMVTGAVALLLQDEPALTPDQVKFRLMNASTTISGSSGDSRSYAYLDVHQIITTDTTASANQDVIPHQLMAKMALLALWASDNGGDTIDWETVDWASVNWNSVNWNSVNWNSVNWNSVNWNSVNWNSVNWNSVNWNSVNWNSVNWNSVNWNSVNWNSVNWNSVNWNSVHWDD